MIENIILIAIAVFFSFFAIFEWQDRFTRKGDN